MRRVLPVVVLIFSFVLASQAANPVPYVNQPLVPATVVPGGSAFTLLVNGTGFVPTSVVKWNGSPRVTTFVNSSRLQAQILASDIANAGTGTVTVSSGGAASNQSFLFIASPRMKPTFTRHLLLEANTPQNAVVGDFNLDGKMDIAGASGYSSSFISWPEVGVLLGNGNGTFQSVTKYKTVLDTNMVVEGDFNNDGVLDLVAAGIKLSKPIGYFGFSVLIGNGDGTFEEQNYAEHFLGIGGILVGDFNRDGNLDLLVVAVNSDLTILLGNGDGTFQPPLTSPQASGYAWESVGDLNGDGILDLVGFGGCCAAAISIGNGDGTFRSPTFVDIPSNAYSVAVADFNGDGKLDIATTTIGFINVCLGNGDGTFQPCNGFQDYPSGNGTLLALDIDGDGKLDLVANHTSVVFSYLLGNGDGTFKPYSSFYFPYPGNFAVGDFNGDGRPDFVLVGGNPQTALRLGFYDMLQQ